MTTGGMANCRYWPLLPVLFATAAAGCVSAIPSASLRWEPPTLSQEGCPDLTGMYRDRGALSQVFYGLGAEKVLGEEPASKRQIIKTPFVSGTPASEMTAAERAFNGRAVV